MIPSFIQPTVTSWKRRLARVRAARELKLVQDGPRGEKGSGILMVAVLRNELLRLPAFFRHYEKLGVRNFVIVDNGSTDGTREFLASRSDVVLFSSQEDFVGKERWVDYLLHKYGIGRWCLIADADELLDYPYSERVKLPALCRYLEQVGANALHAVLLDLYPSIPLGRMNYQQGDDYFAQDWYYDPFESLRKAPRHFFRGSGLDFRFLGGMRQRLFGVSPCCSKFPLLRFSRGMFLTDGQHYLEGAHFSSLRGVLYHFKYLQDFAPRVQEEIMRGQYVWALHEYDAYAQSLENNAADFVLKNEASIKLQGIAQLTECGFAVSSADFERYAKSQEGEEA